jgi:hypothetical protein
VSLAAANAPWADVVLPYSQSRNDLYAEPVECRCPSPLFEDSDIAHLMKNKIRLSGYDDTNFFDRVNAQPREGRCRCGRRYRFQWWRDGVAFAFLPDDEDARESSNDPR